MEINKFIKGIAFGLIAPAIAFLLTSYTTLAQQILPSKPFWLGFIAIFLNLILMRFQFKKGAESQAKGIMVVTFVCTLLYFYIHKF